MQTQNLPLDSINMYGGTQARVTTSDEAIASYAEEMAQGTQFPPIVVFYDGTTYWLADGFHRFLAAKRNESIAISADVQPGGRLDALRHALGANATNGVYRSSADKRNAVEVALEEWPDRANPVIAEMCKVSVDLVRRTRTQLTESGKLTPSEKVTGRDGKEYPSQMQRQPRGKSEGSSSESSGGAGGGGGRGGKGKGDAGNVGGSNLELEREARAMVRKGEINPFELPTIFSATAHDYAETVINLLGTMKVDDPLRQDGLLRIKRWIEKALAGELETATAESPSVA
ncbi:MAG: ParB/Srx family N-terminal domain-containing protein [Opitutus sp.]